VLAELIEPSNAGVRRLLSSCLFDEFISPVQPNASRQSVEVVSGVLGYLSCTSFYFAYERLPQVLVLV